MLKAEALAGRTESALRKGRERRRILDTSFTAWQLRESQTPVRCPRRLNRDCFPKVRWTFQAIETPSRVLLVELGLYALLRCNLLELFHLSPVGSSLKSCRTWNRQRMLVVVMVIVMVWRSDFSGKVVCRPRSRHPWRKHQTPLTTAFAQTKIEVAMPNYVRIHKSFLRPNLSTPRSHIARPSSSTSSETACWSFWISI